MSGAPQRENYFTVVDQLERRIKRLEQTIRDLTLQGALNLPSATAPDAPADGGLIYYEGGVLKTMSPSSGPKTVTVS